MILFNWDRPLGLLELVYCINVSQTKRYDLQQAQNGCGKTCCFALCILSRIDLAEQLTQAMVVVPTRELAIQNTNVLLTMGTHVGLTVLSTSRTDELHRQYFEENGDGVIRQHVRVLFLF